MKPKLLDLFCGGGGASIGYAQAGFEVVGVDIRQQPHYPFEFHCADALEYCAEHGRGFAAVHASPPCQGYSKKVRATAGGYANTKGKDEPRLLSETRALLESTGAHWVMENVIGARGELSAGVLLCGVMFGLHITRHRLFESSDFIWTPEHGKCAGVSQRYAAAHGLNWRDCSVTGKGRNAGTSEIWRRLLGIEAPLLQRQLAEAIPPAFSKFIGTQLLTLIRKETRE